MTISSLGVSHRKRYVASGVGTIALKSVSLIPGCLLRFLRRRGQRGPAPKSLEGETLDCAHSVDPRLITFTRRRERERESVTSLVGKVVQL